MDNNQRLLTLVNIAQTPANGKHFAPLCQDFITRLHPVDKSGVPTGTHPGKSFIDGVKTAFDINHRTYLSSEVSVGNLQELADQLDLEMYMGRNLVVRGKAAHDGIITRVCTPGIDRFGRPKKLGLVDASHHWLMLDVEHVKNTFKLDPCTRWRSIARIARGLLPPAIARVGCFAQMSSSAGMRETAPGSRTYEVVPEGQVPDELNLHLWIWLDTPLNSLEAKSLLTRISAYAVDKLHAQTGQHPAGDKTWIVDSKVAEAHMPHYAASPKFVGHVDPLPEEARGFLLLGASARGDMRDTVVLEELLSQLPPPNVAPKSLVVASKGPKAAVVKKTATPKPPGVTMQPRVLPMLPEARAALDTLRADFPRPARGDANYNDWCMNKLFPARALIESLTLIQDRWQTSDAENGWKDGLPVGARNDFFHALCSLTLELCPLDLTPVQIRNRFRLVAQACGADMTWFAGEWNGVYDRAAIERYVEYSAAGGKCTRDYMGKPVPALYRYRKKSLVPKFCVTEDEAIRLQLRSIVSPKMRDVVDRRLAGGKAREDYLAGIKSSAVEQDAAVGRLLRKGYSQRAVGEELGMSRGSVLKAIARIGTVGAKKVAKTKVTKRDVVAKAGVHAVEAPAAAPRYRAKPAPAQVVVPMRTLFPVAAPAPSPIRMVRPAPTTFIAPVQGTIASVQGITRTSPVRRSSLAPQPGYREKLLPELEVIVCALEHQWRAEAGLKERPTRKAA